MSHKKTSFDSKWKTTYPWVNSVPKDNFSAYCKLCQKIFSLSGKGEDSLKEHAASVTHKSQSLSRYFSSMFSFHLVQLILSMWSSDFQLN